jgi:hypothetical protein
MKSSTRVLALVALLSLVGIAVSALDVREGLIKVSIDESSARFSLYRLADIAKDRYEPLFFEQDVRTSYLSLSFDGRQYKLGDSSDFRQTITRSDTGARIEFKSAFAIVTENLDFARSAGASLADGIRFSLMIENVSQKDASMGMRFILDTSLGEKAGVHFKTPTKEKLAEETVFEGSTFEDWVVSPGATSTFMVQLAGDGIDRPDRVHLANWKRLNDAPWILDASGARNFTLLPYSVNDSALAIYWQPRIVGRGSSYKVGIAMGSFNEKGYPIEVKGSDSGANALFSKTVLSSAGASPADLMSADLVAVRDLLSRIDLVLSSGTAPNPDEISTWKKMLDLLEERKKAY